MELGRQKNQRIANKQRYVSNRVGKKANVAKSYLSSIERNIQSNPSIQFIEKISVALDNSINELLREASSVETVGLDDEWIQIIQEAVNSSVAKGQSKEFIKHNKQQNIK